MIFSLFWKKATRGSKMGLAWSYGMKVPFFDLFRALNANMIWSLGSVGLKSSRYLYQYGWNWRWKQKNWKKQKMKMNGNMTCNFTQYRMWRVKKPKRIQPRSWGRPFGPIRDSIVDMALRATGLPRGQNFFELRLRLRDANGKLAAFHFPLTFFNRLTDDWWLMTLQKILKLRI